MNLLSSAESRGSRKGAVARRERQRFTSGRARRACLPALFIGAMTLGASGVSFAASPSSGFEKGQATFMRFCSFCHILRESEERSVGESRLFLPGRTDALSSESLFALIGNPPPGMPAMQIDADELSELVEFLVWGGPHTLHTDTHHP